MSQWFANLDDLHRFLFCFIAYMVLMVPTLFLPEFTNYSNRKIAEDRVTYDERDD
jgi:hypothetical protein